MSNEEIITRFGIYGTGRVTLKPDYGESPIWFGGPVEFGQAKLSPRLTFALKEWDESFYRGLNQNLTWISKTAHRAFENQGQILAGSLSEELGCEFSVEYRTYLDNVSDHLWQSDQAGTNEAAIEAFRTLASRNQLIRNRALEAIHERRDVTGE